MASLIDIYESSATINQSGFSGAPLYNGVFNNGLDGQQVNGVGGSGLGLTNSTSNPFKPINPTYQNSSTGQTIPFVGTNTYSAGSSLAPPDSGDYQGHY
jgi:hypothetical protein